MDPLDFQFSIDIHELAHSEVRGQLKKQGHVVSLGEEDEMVGQRIKEITETLYNLAATTKPIGRL